ncbi:nitrite reductase [Diaphorobacter sp. HDW4B]|uniref:nitrite reductase n=1 Tax=Diaphorobacter sp. HDW4B TaxID=2714925 RepID=UPI001408D3F5|nr:nitrite reductase [Diaphorobacter sp. HDW4B]QIL72773.1 nitrite reductase [Diaphorobacter sp. HDW4B]
MSEPFIVQGWCPTAWQPMQSQDGWIVRVRPHCASIQVVQWRVLAELSLAHGDAQIELTRLGNVQLRGVAESQLFSLRSTLIAAGLVPADADEDLAPPVHCTPFYRQGDATHVLAQSLSAAVCTHLRPSALQRLGLEALPSKFGLLVDDTQQRLKNTHADVRLWATPDGRYAMSAGTALTWIPMARMEDAVSAAIDLARWFARERMAHQPMPTRLQRVIAQFPRDATTHGAADTESLSPSALPDAGRLIGVPLGRIDAQALLDVIAHMPDTAELRVTPWRSLWIDGDSAHWGKAFQDTTHWITQTDDARLRVSACTGAPRCAQGHMAAQALALHIAPHVPQNAHVHVSGCAKHCALSAEATALISAVRNEEAVQLDLRKPKDNDTQAIHITPDSLQAAPQQIQKLIHDLHLRNQR